MKIIVSHDVDHLSVKEHIFRDLIIPKFFVLQLIEFFKKNISFSEIISRYGEVLQNDWNHLSELQQFNNKNNVKATYFFWMDNALWLNYSQEEASVWIKYLLDNWADVWVHWINYDDEKLLKKEFEDFKKLSWLNSVWLRMHYLRQDKNTQNHLADIWYSFDVTDYAEKKYSIWKKGNMDLLPFQLMDTYLFSFNRRAFSSNEAIEYSINLLKEAEKKWNNYFSLLIHQRHFSKWFSAWKNWYIEFIKYCNENWYEFINYKDFIKTLK